ncbi:hypothetical protein [Thiolapillus sp.]|uniref:hypothetical protein n=1 Tax=Thiolapillus sp. TaxID=2017437 RepID=UPI003AF84ADA
MNIEKSTLAEYQERIQAGCEPVSFEELRRRGEELGYRLKAEFKYINTANPRPWHALSCNWIEKSSGLSFANIGAPRHNLKALQALRINTVCLYRGQLVEY